MMGALERWENLWADPDYDPYEYHVPSEEDLWAYGDEMCDFYDEFEWGE